MNTTSIIQHLEPMLKEMFEGIFEVEIVDLMPNANGLQACFYLKVEDFLFTPSLSFQKIIEDLEQRIKKAFTENKYVKEKLRDIETNYNTLLQQNFKLSDENDGLVKYKHYYELVREMNRGKEK